MAAVGEAIFALAEGRERGPGYIGLVYWPYALVMAASAVLGGFAGAKLAKRMPAGAVRWTVVAIGFGLALFYATR